MAKKTGRKGLYHKWLEKDNLMLLRGWAREGLTDEEIALKMGIHVSTLYTWKNKYSEIDEALKKGKDVIDFEVEESLIKAALGYSYEEETVVKVKDSHGNEQAQIKKVKKHAHPNVTALIFWLKNRKPDVWRNAPKNATEQEEQEWRIKKLKAETALLEIGEDDSETSIISFLEATRKSKEDVGAVFNDDD